VVHFLRGQHAVGGHFPGVEDLAAQRQDRLEILVAGLLGAAACRVALDQEQFGARQVLADAVGQLAGQGRALGDLLADDQLLGLLARSMAICAIFSPSSTFWFSSRLNASCAAPSTKPAAWREDRRSLVWPLNC